MKKGSIANVLNHYSKDPSFKPELRRAIIEFYDLDESFQLGDAIKTLPGDEQRFGEWLLFEFKLEDGETSLEDFIKNNPLQYSPSKLRFYKEIQENEYGIFEVLQTRLGVSLTLRNLQTGKKYQVKEYMGTFSLQKGNVISGRVGKVENHYELVGSDSLLLTEKIDRKTTESLLKDKKKLSLLDVQRILRAKSL